MAHGTLYRLRGHAVRRPDRLINLRYYPHTRLINLDRLAEQRSPLAEVIVPQIKQHSIQFFLVNHRNYPFHV